MIKARAHGSGLYDHGTRSGRLFGREFGFVLVGRALGVLAEELLYLLRGRLIVDLLDRGEFARHSLERLLIELALGVRLLGLTLGAVEVAHHFGDRDEITRIDFRFIFLSAPRPHRTLNPGAA